MADKKPGIYENYKPTDFEKEMRDYVYDRYRDMKNSKDRQIAEKDWEKGYEQWEALRVESRGDDWQSNHYVPLTTAVVETAVSEIIDQSPKPMILPRGLEDTAKAHVMEQVFKYTWDISYSDLAEEDILRDALICGTGIGQEYYFRDKRMIQTKLKKGSKQEYEEQEMVDYDDVMLEPVKLEDFFIDEQARGFVGTYAARDCIRRYIMDIDSYKSFFKGPIWDPMGNAKYVEPGGDTNYYEKYKPPEGIDHSKQVEVLWFWAVKPKDWLIIVANDVMQVMGPNPYKHKQLPFSRAIDVRRTHKFYGKGEPKLLESIQDEANTFRRMIIDRNHLDIDKMFYGSNRLNVSDEETIARPHGFINVPEGGDIKPVEYGDIPRSVELSLKHLEDDGTIVTGINPRAQALPTPGTATEAAILKESTLKRIRLKVRRFEREFLTRVATLRVANILQYYSQPKLEKIIGEEGDLEYENQIKELEERGLLVKNDQGTFKQKFRDIRLEGKEINIEKGEPKIMDSSSEYNFFELTPKYFFPIRGMYDIRITVGSTLPPSKSLMHSQTQETFDRLIEPAVQGIGNYDPGKLMDMLVRSNDKNPTELKKDLPVRTETEARVEMQIELANQENKLMMKGQQIPGTAYVGPLHTLIHVKFTGSPEFQNLPPTDPRVNIFTTHITEELATQSERSPGGPGAIEKETVPGRVSEAPNSSNGANNDLSALLTGKVQGGGQVARENPAF